MLVQIPGVSFIRTIQPGVVRFDVSLLHGTVLNNQSIPLGAVAAEDGGTIEVEIERFGEGHTGVSKEANLGHCVSCVHRTVPKDLVGGALTPLEPEGSRVLPHAFMLSLVRTDT
jgi:hypothetical protein